jgi:hypothetical protein
MCHIKPLACNNRGTNVIVDLHLDLYIFKYLMLIQFIVFQITVFARV